MLDFRKENSAMVQQIREISENAWHIVRYARIKEMTEIIENAMAQAHNMAYDGKIDTYITYRGKQVKAMIKKGASKVVVIVENAIVIKTDYNTKGYGKQTESEVNKYQELLHQNHQALEYIVPVLKYYPRHNTSITPCCSKVCSLSEAIEITNNNHKYDRIMRAVSKARINDLHGYNCGVLFNKPVVLDYGL